MAGKLLVAVSAVSNRSSFAWVEFTSLENACATIDGAQGEFLEQSGKAGAKHGGKVARLRASSAAKQQDVRPVDGSCARSAVALES